MSSNDEDKRIKNLEKELKRYRKRYEKTLQHQEMTSRMLENYEAFYQNTIDELKNQKQCLDKKNNELVSIKNTLVDKNSELEALNEQLERIALEDTLTGLANRKNFLQRLEEAIAESDRFDQGFCLLFIDLDGFKSVNDTYGHTRGDELLKIIATRLKSAVRTTDFIARLGGDEFVVILHHNSTEQQGVDVANRIIHVCHQNVSIQDVTLCVSASVGLLFYPYDEVLPSDISVLTYLQQCADQAMYEAKLAGKNQFAVYNSHLSEKAREESTFYHQTVQALNQKAFTPFFQPMYCVRKKQLIGCEALVRWYHQDKGLLAPDAFLPLIENMKRLPDLDFLMLEKVCQFIDENTWVKESIEYISVNISVETFSCKTFVSRFVETLTRFNTPYDMIVAELTEHSCLEEDSLALMNMKKLRQLGIKLALDDFGVGYSTLSYLDRLPISLLKIDRYFVSKTPSSPFTCTVVKQVMELAQTVNFKVIAEGVEEFEQYQYLLAQHCDILQGYYFSKPLSGHDLKAIFAKEKTIYHDNVYNMHYKR